MSHADLVVRANDRSLEETPDVLKRIGVNDAAYVLFLKMIDRRVRFAGLKASAASAVAPKRFHTRINCACSRSINLTIERENQQNRRQNLYDLHRITVISRSLHYSLAIASAIPRD